MSPLLLILLILLVIGVFPRWPYSSGWGYGPFGVILIIVLIVIVLGYR